MRACMFFRESFIHYHSNCFVIIIIISINIIIIFVIIIFITDDGSDCVQGGEES